MGQILGGDQLLIGDGEGLSLQGKLHDGFVEGIAVQIYLAEGNILALLAHPMDIR